jgi:hypothetical protein
LEAMYRHSGLKQKVKLSIRESNPGLPRLTRFYS